MKKLNSNERQSMANLDNNGYAYQLADGTTLLFASVGEVSMANYGIPYCYNKSAGIIFVDINGTKNKPNKMGRDVFVFMLYPCGDKKIPTFVPAGVYEDIWGHYASKHCAPSSSEFDGVTCAHKVILERGMNY